MVSCVGLFLLAEPRVDNPLMNVFDGEDMAIILKNQPQPSTNHWYMNGDGMSWVWPPSQ